RALKLREDISFAVEEIVRNAYVHGNNLELGLDVTVRWKKQDNSLVLEVEDQAVPGRPDAALMKIARQAELHGQLVGMQVVSIDFQVETFTTPEGKNVYRLLKRLPGESDEGNVTGCDMSRLPVRLPSANAYRLKGAGELPLEDTRAMNELRMAARTITGDYSGGPFKLRCLRLGTDIVRFTGLFADMLSDQPEIRSLPAEDMERLRDAITMSLDEALKNAYVHGNGMDLSLDVVLRWEVEGGVLRIEVEDHNVKVPVNSRKIAIAGQSKLHGASSGVSYMKKYFDVRRSGPPAGEGKKVFILSRELDGGRSLRITEPEDSAEEDLSSGLAAMPGMNRLFPAGWLGFLETELSARPGGKRELEKITEDLEKISPSGNGTLFRSLEELWELLSIREYLENVMDKEYEEKIHSVVFARTLIYSQANDTGARFLRDLTQELNSLISGDNRTLERLRKEFISKPMEFIARYSSKMRSAEGVTRNTFREDPLSPREKISRGGPVVLLFVCALNANRSFLLDIISRDIVRSRPGLEHVSIDSCGVAVTPSAHNALVKAALDRGVPAEIADEFSPKKISGALLENADHVVVTDPFIMQYIEKEFPDHAGKLMAVADILPDMTKRLFDSAEDIELGNYMLDYLAVDEVIPPVDYYDILREGLERELFGLENKEEGSMPVEDAVPDDTRVISRLSSRLYGSGGGRLDEKIIRDLIAKQADRRGAAYIKVFRDKGRPVAYIIADNSPVDGRKRLNITQLVVEESYRGRGLARKLFRAVYKEARRCGYDLFSVITGARTVASICLAHGFSEDTATGEMVLDHSGDTSDADVFSPKRPDRISIESNARHVVPRMVNALVTASRERQKLVLALDTGLGRGDINSFVRKFIWQLPALEGNNRDLALFLRDLEIISGPASVLAGRLDNITDSERGDVRAENVIVVTSRDEMHAFRNLAGRSIIAAVDDRYLPERAYMPYVQVLFFALGKYLGWDRDRMEECYRMIPNALPLDQMSGAELDLLDPVERSFLIKLIPDAVRFNRDVQVDINENIRRMLAMA
ncbi:MAG: GNAT family N-acetyltransferase, partial [Candidatus Omnitrophica bacterium]|nr:GNAT family N-acetyltransferase [Candidatus Omnitrophota bacterium]